MDTRRMMLLNASAGEEGGGNIIYYTSTNGNIVTPYSTTAFGGATIISNTYTDGVGVLKFNSKVTSIGNNAFSGKTTLLTVEIPDSITSIGE